MYRQRCESSELDGITARLITHFLREGSMSSSYSGKVPGCKEVVMCWIMLNQGTQPKATDLTENLHMKATSSTPRRFARRQVQDLGVEKQDCRMPARMVEQDAYEDDSNSSFHDTTRFNKGGGCPHEDRTSASPQARYAHSVRIENVFKTFNGKIMEFAFLG